MELLKQAASQLGLKEIKGEKDNPDIVEFATFTGIPGISDDEVPWCSTFINWCAKKAKLPFSGKANARSWLQVGTAVQNPEPGDVVVFWRESPQSWKGHVGIFLGFGDNSTKIFCLGGNQGDAVSIASYDAGKVLGFRRLEQTSSFRIPTPVLKLKDKGPEVSKLQIILNHLSYNCGDVDGDFGKKTEDALKMLQANNHLTIDGEYRKKTHTCIESLLQA